MNDFIIKLGALTNGINSFSFDIKDQFFEAFTLSDVAHADIIATALLDKNPNPTNEEIDEAMIGNICRCGTYQRIKNAINRTVKLKNQN